MNWNPVWITEETEKEKTEKDKKRKVTGKEAKKKPEKNTCG